MTSQREACVAILSENAHKSIQVGTREKNPTIEVQLPEV